MVEKRNWEKIIAETEEWTLHIGTRVITSRDKVAYSMAAPTPEYLSCAVKHADVLEI